MKSKRLLLITILFAFVIVSRAFAFQEIKWEFKAPVTSEITIHQDNLLFGDAVGNFYSVNKNSGSVVWTHKGRGTITKTPAVIDDPVGQEKIIYITSEGVITCLNLNNGALIWEYDPGENFNEGIYDGVSVSTGENLAFVSKVDAKLYALDVNTGRTVWTFQANQQGLRTIPAYSDGLVFLGEYNGIFDIIDAKTGERINGGGAGGAINTPSVNDGKVYFSAWDGSVNSIQIKSVIPLWHVNIKDTITTPPVISSGIIALGTGRGFVTALNEKDGSLKWRANCENGSVSESPIIANGKIYAAPEGGNIYEIDADSGKIINVFETDGMISALAYSDGVLYFCSFDTLYALKN